MAKILFPLDGTEDSYDAIDAGLDVLGRDHDVTLLTVMQTMGDAGDDRVAMFADHDDQIMPTQAACQEVLDEGAARCRAHGVASTVKVREGRPVAEIIAESAAHDILVMHALAPTRMRDRLRFAHGGRLTRRAGCHVLLVHTAARSDEATAQTAG